MNTTRSRFHLAGSKQILNRAPELSLAPDSVHDKPSACGTRRGSLGVLCSCSLGRSGASEHPARVRTSAMAPYEAARFIQEPPELSRFQFCTAARGTGSGSAVVRGRSNQEGEIPTRRV